MWLINGKSLLILFGLVLVVVIISALVLFASTNVTPTLPNPAEMERGGQINLPVITPQPTGPTEPKLPTATPPVATNIVRPTLTQTPLIIPTATPVPDKSLIPYKIKIPAIKLDTYVEQVGVTPEGNMDVPKNIWNTAWFSEGGFRPGEKGNAVIAGHLDAPGTKAIFWDLNRLKIGDKIYVIDVAGRELTFEITGLQVYFANNAPLQEIFGASNFARLNLITCGGSFDRNSRSYNQRLVVFSRIVE
jgi:LPXTG-site transpeptidase (sortase) family protein